jgi:hypothetical protein
MMFGFILMSRIGIAALAGLLLSASPVQAASVALIEDINGNPAGLEIMDYLDSGSILRLDARDSLVITYFSSCVREKIRGGIVTIGTRQSDVQSGEVERTTVKCDGGKMLHPRSVYSGLIAGNPSADVQTPLASPQAASRQADVQLIIHGTSPIFEVKPPGVLFIDRIDTDSEQQEIDVDGEPLLHGRFYDFAEHSRMLTAGGIYRARFEAWEIVFKIDARAAPGHSPIVGRLIRLVPLR